MTHLTFWMVSDSWRSGSWLVVVLTELSSDVSCFMFHDPVANGGSLSSLTGQKEKEICSGQLLLAITCIHSAHLIHINTQHFSDIWRSKSSERFKFIMRTSIEKEVMKAKYWLCPWLLWKETWDQFSSGKSSGMRMRWKVFLVSTVCLFWCFMFHEVHLHHFPEVQRLFSFRKKTSAFVVVSW